MPEDTLNQLNQAAAAVTGLAPETAPSGVDLDEFAKPTEGEGAWAKGWYRATIIPGYSTGRGKVMESSDVLSQTAGSRNLFLCFAVNGEVYVPSDPDPSKRKLTKGPGGVRNIRNTYNYKPADLSEEGMAIVKNARANYKGKQGAWGEQGTEASRLQASSLSLGRLGQLQKAVGFKVPFSKEAQRHDVRPFLNQLVDVHLGIDKKGFSEITDVAKAGDKVK
jgi:hypothetical protein